jgi:A/G-specific adenine glycosylase
MAPSINREDTGYFRRLVLRWGRQNFKDFPWRRSKNPWHGLVAEIMLQRTKADQVSPAFMTFTAKYQRPEDFLASPASLFSRLGLPIRDEQFLALNRALVAAGLPTEKAALMRLPGVGDYIASAFVSLHLGKRAALVDANTVRVYGRFFGFETNPETRRKRWLVELAEDITPVRVFKDYNYAIIDFSREICAPRKPQHEVCPLRRKCRYLQKVVDKRR